MAIKRLPRRVAYDAVLRLMEAQGGRCAICRAYLIQGKACADHCHTTGRVRGVLCRRCDSAIALLDDDPKRCRRAAAYLSQRPRSDGL